MKSTADEYGIHHIQEQSFAILQFFDDLCRQNNLVYYLAYGTLLGAVRHEGFIPWDDDIDIWMPRKDYMKLLDYLKTKNDHTRYVLNEGPYKPKGDRPSEFQMRILDLQGSLERTYAGKTIEVHPWIDIFALDNFPQKKKEGYLKKFKWDLLVYKFARCKNFVVEQNSFFGKMNKLIYFLHQKFKLFFFISEEKCMKKTIKGLTKYEGCVSDEYFCYAAVYLPKPDKCFFKTDWFGTPKELSFEGQSFYVPQNCDGVLRHLYSNYMQLPPEDQRRPTHGANHD